MKLFKAFIFCLCLILILNGCSSVTQNVANEETAEMSNEQPVVEDVVESGGSINISMRNPSTFNPLLNGDVTVDRVLSLIFEPLFVLDENQNVVGNLAESYSLSEDGKKMTISLKNGIKWSDGYDVTARDIAYSLDTIKNAPADAIYKYVMANVADYYAVGSNSFVIEYAEAFGGCEYNLCFPVIPRHYYSGKTDSMSIMPLGNGSYKVADYRIVRYMTLVSDENALDVPNIKQINVYIIPDKETDMNAFEQGIIDVLVTDLGNLGRYDSTENINVTVFNSNQFEFLGFNHNLTVLNNRSVRQAIAFALPLDNIVENIFVGRAVKSITPVNPTSVLSSTTGIETYEYNQELAQSMLNSSGIDFSEQTFTIMVNQENTERVEMASLMANALSQIGMKVDVENVDFNTYITRLANDDFQMFIGGIEFKDRVELSSFLSTGGNANYFNYSDEQMNRLIDNCYYASSSDSYKKSINALQKYFSEQLPCIGIAFKSQVLLTNSKIKGEKKPIMHNAYYNINQWYISGITNQ